MTINELKEYIYNENKIEYILKQLNCHNIKFNQKHENYSASFPDGDNPQGINIRNNKYLNYRSFSRGIDYEDNQDLISLVETTKKLTWLLIAARNPKVKSEKDKQYGSHELSRSNSQNFPLRESPTVGRNFLE